jgi:hypothetical protein
VAKFENPNQAVDNNHRGEMLVTRSKFLDIFKNS